MEPEVLHDGPLSESFGPLMTLDYGSPVGIVIQGEFDAEGFEARCHSLAKVRNFSPFAVGDVFLKAVEVLGEKKAFQDKYIKAADHAEKSIRTYVDVCKAVPYPRRRPRPLAFEHHSVVSKIKSPGCSQHQATGPETGCEPCDVARLEEISAWLDKAEKHKWSAKELKDQLRDKTKVREHQRKLDGESDFDVETFKESLGVLKHRMMAVKENSTGLLNGGKLHRGKAKTLRSKLEELQTAITDVTDKIDAETK